jgi:hypothetical protein
MSSRLGMVPRGDFVRPTERGKEPSRCSEHSVSARVQSFQPLGVASAIYWVSQVWRHPVSRETKDSVTPGPGSCQNSTS